MIPLSVLDLAPIHSGHDAADALQRCLSLARHAEACGYQRYWLAEHHNIDGLACSATVVLIAHIAAGTERIRVGSGGIMLPNHAPLVVAEQFGTLATLHPGRIDLGLGRAPGSDGSTMHALRRCRAKADEQDFPEDVIELLSYLAPPDVESPGKQAARVRAIPGMGTCVPIWLLGSSTYSAQLAARLGLPFAFASHFAPDLLDLALNAYRSNYCPSADHPRPYAMVAVNVVAADESAQARRLFTSIQQRFLGIIRGNRGPLPAPVATMDGRWSKAERTQVERMLAVSVVGDRAEVRAGLEALQARTRADELIVTGAIHDPMAMLRSCELTAEAAI